MFILKKFLQDSSSTLNKVPFCKQITSKKEILYFNNLGNNRS